MVASLKLALPLVCGVYNGCMPTAVEGRGPGMALDAPRQKWRAGGTGSPTCSLRNCGYDHDTTR